MNIEKMKIKLTIKKYETTNMELGVRIAEREEEIARLKKTIKENQDTMDRMKEALDE